MSAIKGMESLLKKIESLNVSSREALKKGIAQAAKKVQGDAKELCPADTGQLRNSIQTRVEETEEETVGIISTNLEYAPYVEFGTGQKGEASPSPPKFDGSLSYRQDWPGNRAQPFLYPAATQNRKQVVQIVENQLLAEIRKLGE